MIWNVLNWLQQQTICLWAYVDENNFIFVCGLYTANSRLGFSHLSSFGCEYFDEDGFGLKMKLEIRSEKYLRMYLIYFWWKFSFKWKNCLNRNEISSRMQINIFRKESLICIHYLLPINIFFHSKEIVRVTIKFHLKKRNFGLNPCIDWLHR